MMGGAAAPLGGASGPSFFSNPLGMFSTVAHMGALPFLQLSPLQGAMGLLPI